MNCPKCGKEIKENQKFCGHCGAKLDEIENLQENQEIIENLEDTATDDTDTEKPIKHGLNSSTKKIIIAIICIILIILSAFGIVQYRQYQKDIAPFETTITFVDNNDIICTLTYDRSNKTANLSMLHKGIIIEQWQKDYMNENNLSYDLKNTNDTGNYKFDFENYELDINKPLIANFRVSSVDNVKKFVKFKNDFNSLSFTRSIAKALSENEKTRLEEKNKWLKEKEAERKQKEWRERILSNCVYKTSTGVCFTTQVFEVEPILEENPKNPNFPIKNYWFGAKDTCESQGYKLPNDDELRSLYADILGIEINAGTNVLTEKYSTSTIPTNYEIFKKIAPRGFAMYSTGDWGKVNLWENEEFNSEDAYCRDKYKDWGNDVTKQSFVNKDMSSLRGICVYNPNGKPYKSLLKTQKEEIEKYKQEQKRKEKQLQDEAENALF